MRALYTVVPLLVGLAALTCPPPAVAAVVELIRDPHFRHGFTVSAPAPGRHVLAGVFRPTPAGPDPVWRVNQWNSRYPLTDFSPQPAGEGAVALANAAKCVRIARPGTSGADLTLALNAWLEYPERARRFGELWPHLLVDQEFPRETWMSDLTALHLHLQGRLRKCDLKPGAENNPAIHAAQVVMFISVQNRNPASPGFGDYYHFGVPIFDNRERFTSPLIMGDPVVGPAGTGKLIYSTAATAWSTDSINDGNWVTFDGDLLPEMLKGLQAAWDRGFLKDFRNLSDYRPAGMSVGWEVTGVFDVAIQLRDLSLRATTR